MRIYPYLRFCG